MREGIVGVVNELLVQMQSFDLPTGSQKFKAWWIDWINGFLPDARRKPRPTRTAANVLIVASTNRAADLDPALLRPGRFDRVITFNLPARSDRVAIAEYYLGKKNHVDEVTAALIADHTAGYTPVRIEKLLDEALIIALRYQRTSMTVSDVLEAQLVTEVGIAQEMGYHPDERRRIAIHEAGHALTAVLTRRDVKVASILRRSSALGLVAHGDSEERFLQDAERRPRPDHRRARRAGGGAAGVRRGEQRHLVRPRRGHDDRRRSSSASSATARACSASRRRRCRRRPTSSPRCCPTSRAGEAAEALMAEGADAGRLDGVELPAGALRHRRRPVRERRTRRRHRSRRSSRSYTDITERRGPVRIKPPAA